MPGREFGELRIDFDVPGVGEADQRDLMSAYVACRVDQSMEAPSWAELSFQHEPGQAPPQYSLFLGQRATVSLSSEGGRSAVVSGHVVSVRCAAVRGEGADQRGGATQVKVNLVARQQAVLLDIEDNGRGMDINKPGRGLGLIGMRERIEALDGTLTVASTPGRGVSIHVNIPLALETTV